jgi:hypothetical protein
MRTPGLLLPIVLLAFPAVCAAQAPSEEAVAQQARRLSSDEIRGIHAGHTLLHENIVSGLKVAIWFAPDGTRYFRTGNRQFTGAWVARDDKRCEETVAGPVVCMTVYQRGNDLVYCDPREAPECRWVVTRRQAGDTENLGRKP